MNIEQIIEILKEHNISIGDFAHGDFDDDILGPWKEVDQCGGEGQGDGWYSVKYFKDHDIYVRTDGYYQSYNGVDFYDGYGKIVSLKTKTVQVYE